MDKAKLQKKLRASQRLTKQLRLLYSSIAPLSLKTVKQVKTNNKIFSDFIKIMSSQNVQYLYQACLSDHDGAPIRYIQDALTYINGSRIRSAEAVKYGVARRSTKSFSITKRAFKQYRQIMKQPYHYLHYYEKEKTKPISPAFAGGFSSYNVFIVTQLNIPSKKLILSMIKNVIWGASTQHIYDQDKFALHDLVRDYKCKYSDALSNLSQCKTQYMNAKHNLAQFQNYFD